MSMYVKKGYGSWLREYSLEYWPHEQGMERLCKMEKSFLNKAPLHEVLANEPLNQWFCSISVITGLIFRMWMQRVVNLSLKMAQVLGV